MKFVAILSLLTIGCGTTAFVPAPPLTARSVGSAVSSACVIEAGYVPDGLTAEQWEAMKAKERAAKANKNLGAVGVKNFKSRSLRAWQEAGAPHLFPVNPAEAKTEAGAKALPYMMRRGGRWDNADLNDPDAALAWTEADVMYEAGGERAAQSVSFFGGGAPFPNWRMPWTGRTAPAGASVSPPAGDAGAKKQ